jgi:anti-sigma28 factor (negative regulator of flagellin synthesis)
MKIDPKGLPQNAGHLTSVAPSSRGRLDGTGGRAPAGAPVPSDGLTLSPRAEEFRRLRPRVEDVNDPGRSERVARLATLVAGGAYDVSGEQIAAAMLRDATVASLLGADTPE